MDSTRLTDALGHSVADKRIDILRAIGRTGSISQAARDVAVSYKSAWQAVDTLTNLAGVPLVERAVGGVGGGGALLTPQGEHLLALAEALDAARQAVHAQWAARNAQSDGNLQAARVAHTVYARLSLRTSMRNQLPCTVVTLETVGRIVRVTMHLAGGGVLAARITQESAELLGLAEGLAVVALCKATAVRVCPAGSAAEALPPGNRLVGTVAEVAPGEWGDEVAVELAAGLRMVGFAKPGSGTAVQQSAVVAVDEATVVVALPG